MKQLERLETGVPGLDTLLKGGLVSGASYIIQGRPGSGKTILANQIGFNHVKRGGRMLFASLLAEPHDRLFQFLSTLTFFDKAQVGSSIQFVSAFDTLETDGLDEVVKLLRREISRQQSTLLILDGLLNARSKAESPIDTKKFISALQGHAAFAGCTVLFLTSSQIDEGSPEHTMVDGVIQMGEDSTGATSVRRLQLRKTRGSGAVSGSHEFEINEHGLVIYPRLESLLPALRIAEDSSPARVTSGISSLDKSLGDGLVKSSITLVLGPSGVGKTSLGLQFLSASTPDEPGLHFGFHESPQRVRSKADALALGYPRLMEKGALQIMWRPTSTGLIDQVCYELLQVVDRDNVRRVFIDSLSGFERVSADPARVRGVLVALLEQLRSRGVTVLATYELHQFMSSMADYSTPELSSTVDNLLLVEFARKGAELHRQLTILKVRDSAFDPSILQVVMSGTGIELRRV
ncbi:RAD55 family ATPase [Pseudomonas sp. NPDC088444]|uniref:RAD55 family ATPase n=1 Tax=Pseudomonas sp. NPDC088444 TaxID=3364456 RepID=UPI00384FD2D5